MVIHLQSDVYAADLFLLGLLLSHTVFLAYMVVLRKSVNAGLAVVLIVSTVVVKLM